MKIGDLVLITWIDAVSHDAWTAAHDAQMHPAEIKTLGFLFELEKTHVTVVQSIDQENHAVAGIFCVPKGMVKHIKKLKC